MGDSIEARELEALAFRALGRFSVGLTVTRRGEVVYCNEAFASMIGLSQESLVGHTHPFLDRTLVTNAMYSEFQAYCDGPNPTTPIRVSYVRGDGVEAWCEVQLCPEGDYTTWTHRDISAQVATHELWQRYEFLLNTSLQFMALVNQDHAYDLVNRAFAEAFGATPEDVNGSGASTLWGKSLYSAIVAPDLERCLQGEVVQTKHWVELPVGGRRFLDMIYTPYRDDAGEVIHAVFVAWDVTAEKLATDAVQDSNRQLEQRVAERTAALEDTLRELEAFNYTIAHDLRSPLRFLKSFTHLLEESGELTDSAANYVSMIANGVAEMQRMIDHLLNFARLGKKPLCLDVCDLNAVVAAAADVLLEAAADVSIESLPVCQGDEALLKQVFVNLLQNAEKFSRRAVAPRVRVYEVSAEPGMIGVCVEDNGIGFHMSQADAIFSPFKQLHEMQDEPGSGLGLAIVRRIVERHGGRVWARGEEGDGACIFITLPGAGNAMAAAANDQLTR